MCIPQQGRGLRAEVCAESAGWPGRRGGAGGILGPAWRPHPALLCRQRSDSGSGVVAVSAWTGGRSGAALGGAGRVSGTRHKARARAARGWDGATPTAQSGPAQARWVPPLHPPPGHLPCTTWPVPGLVLALPPRCPLGFRSLRRLLRGSLDPVAWPPPASSRVLRPLRLPHPVS